MTESGIADLPFITADLAGVGGGIKEKAEHFVVEEIPLYEPDGQGPHVYLTLKRAGLTTREVVDELAAGFEIAARDIGYAGLKDKQAISTQTFSLPVSLSDDEIMARLRNPAWGVVSVSRHKNKLKVGHLLGNRFTIVLSGSNGDIDQALAIAEHLKTAGVPNYFGEQRFGKDGDNMAAGLKLLKSGRRPKNWRDKFLLSALQSFIYNHYLALRIKGGLFSTVLTGDVCKKHATGGLFVSENGQVETERLRAGELTHTGPIFGSKMKRALDTAGELESRALSEIDLTEDEAAKTGLGDRRANRLLVNELTVDKGADGLVFSFALPKGAYATSVMREFIKV